MIEVDGAEGGGQLLRSALTLSVLAGEPVAISDIRGDRPEPGLRPQHLAVVGLLADLCDAEVSDAAAGTESLRFDPGELRPGRYGIDVGTAGSVTLVFDAVLPLALALEEPLVVAARGGTDVKWSPTMAHYRRVKLPLLRRQGLKAAVEETRPGFYPAGGGEATLHLAPSSLDRFDRLERGDLEGARIVSLESADLADRDVADRQARAAGTRLETADVPVLERVERTAAARSPGSAVAIRLDYGATVAGVDDLGERGRAAEDVGEDAAEAALEFHEGAGAVDRHTADQLLGFLALAGGRLRIPAVTDHVDSLRDLLETFGFEVAIDDGDGGPVVRAPGRERFRS